MRIISSKLSCERGFFLIELAIVVAMLVVLTEVAVSQTTQAGVESVAKSCQKNCETGMNALSRALAREGTVPLAKKCGWKMLEGSSTVNGVTTTEVTSVSGSLDKLVTAGYLPQPLRCPLYNEGYNVSISCPMKGMSYSESGRIYKDLQFKQSLTLKSPYRYVVCGKSHQKGNVYFAPCYLYGLGNAYMYSGKFSVGKDGSVVISF